MRKYTFLFLIILAVSCENNSTSFESIYSWSECKLFEKNLKFDNGSVAGIITGVSISDSIIISYSLGKKYEADSEFILDELNFLLSDDTTGISNFPSTESTNQAIVYKTNINERTCTFSVKPWENGIHSQIIYVFASALIKDKNDKDCVKILIKAESDGSLIGKQGCFTFEYICKREN